ncbi:acetylxylan esterase [Streptomyces sp. NPDC004284]|uniref:acetylxylan esterase n=1 Tax=Streptomyces sp. NPDC004284 TaxID=3364695 RepID=UPI0036C1A151
MLGEAYEWPGRPDEPLNLMMIEDAAREVDWTGFDDAHPDTEAARRDLGARLVAALAPMPGDPTCPPSTVFAAYNRYRGTKDTQVWPFADHGGGHGTERHVQLNRIEDQGLLPTRT